MKKTLTNLTLLLASTVFSLLAVEAILRISGHQPWQYLVHENEPTMHEHDDTLGWRNKAGQYEFPGYTARRNPIQMTFFEGGLRRARVNQEAIQDQRPKMVFVGGSFTQGWGISDRRTYPWKVQRRFPKFEVLNYGTGGYGTYQALLTLERALPTLNDPRVVLYGFMAHHQNRNVATDTWLETLSKYSNRSHVFVPYATVDDQGGLVRHPPEAYTTVPLRNQLALANLLGKGFMRARTEARKRQAHPVTQAILQEMNKLSHSHGARLVVVMLQANQTLKSTYEAFLARHDIPVIDCVFSLTPDMRIRREGHPNGKANAQWAKCIIEQLKELQVAPNSTIRSTASLTEG